MTIFDMVTAQALASYWNTMAEQRAPYLGETLFPDRKKRGLSLKWIKGSRGLPVVLAPSAYDVKAKTRDRIGFSDVSTNMPFFKEKLSIDEEMRQELNLVMDSANGQAYIDSIMSNVFDDQTNLLDGARAQRERMRMQLLTSGTIAVSANGQEYNYDYGLDESQKPTVSVSWSDPSADLIGDIESWQDLIEDKTGMRPTRAVFSRKTLGYMLKNTGIINANFVLSNGKAAMTESVLKSYLQERLGLSYTVYTKKYVDEQGAAKAYVPDDVFSLFPEGNLGYTWFGTTPEESDLMSGQVSQGVNVSVVDTGVAITTSPIVDPVNVDTKVSMISLPSLEMADYLLIADLSAD